jgi:hypothetical protein
MQLISSRTFQSRDHLLRVRLSAFAGFAVHRVRTAWEDCQATRDRDAIYAYLSAVYGLVSWWAAEGREVDRARRALRLQRLKVSDREDAFAAIIPCATQPCTRQIPRHWTTSSSARAASTRARLGSRAAWGEVERRGSVCHVDQCRFPVRRNIEALGQSTVGVIPRNSISNRRPSQIPPVLSNSAQTKPIERA